MLVNQVPGDGVQTYLGSRRAAVYAACVATTRIQVSEIHFVFFVNSVKLC